jgi:hypothetical protein
MTERAPVPTRDKDNRLVHFVGRYWPRGLALGAAIGAVSFGAFGFTEQWGAQQWGPYSEWLAGGATLAAVVVALRESFKGDRARRIDHEVSRRRECIDALSELWEGITTMAVRLPHFTGFLEKLSYTFDPKAPLGDHPLMGTPSDEKAGVVIQGKSVEFMNLWNEEIGSRIFKALALMGGTPLDQPLQQLNNDLNLINTEIGRATVVAVEGRRPNLEAALNKWEKVTKRRSHFVHLAREHFSLDLKDVEENPRHE